MRMQEYVQNYLEYCEYRKELDKNTLKAYRIDLRQYFEYVKDEEISKSKIEKYITNLHKKYKQKTVKRKIASIRAFYAYLEDEEIIIENPMRRIRTKFKIENTLPRIISRGDIEKLINKMYEILREKKDARIDILRDLLVIEVFFATGARVYEVSNIKIENIDLESGTIRFEGKGRKERVVQISDKSVCALLKHYYKENEEKICKCGFFFVNQCGRRFTEQSIRRMLKKYVKQAGIEKRITPHMFRHSFATYLIEEGVDISCVQHILGHSSIKTTQIYIHVAAKKQADILRKLHPRNKMNIKVA